MNNFYFWEDLKKATGGRSINIIPLMLQWSTYGLLMYRIENFLFLLFGRRYKYLRILFLPVITTIQGLSNIAISYKTNIGPGLSISHANMGLEIGSDIVIGSNFSCVGGNVIGRNLERPAGGYKIGDNVSLGANAVVIGPVTIGDNVTIGAMACVVSSIDSKSIVGGVPAKVIKIKE